MRGSRGGDGVVQEDREERQHEECEGQREDGVNGAAPDERRSEEHGLLREGRRLREGAGCGVREGEGEGEGGGVRHASRCEQFGASEA